MITRDRREESRGAASAGKREEEFVRHAAHTRYGLPSVSCVDFLFVVSAGRYTPDLETSNMKRGTHFSLAILVVSLLAWMNSVSSGGTRVPLSTLDISKMSAGWGTPVANKSVQSKPLSIAGRAFDDGVGTHAPSTLWIDLKGDTSRFTAWVGVDDEVGNNPGSVEFKIVADDKTIYRSGLVKAGSPAQQVDVDLTGKKLLMLIVTDARDNQNFDHANWCDAVFDVAGTRPVAIDAPPVPEEPKIILTPKPGPRPRINGPRLFGERPGRPFIYRIPCTGERPMTFRVDGLPDGLSLDAKTGIITGTVPIAKGNYTMQLVASNKLAEAKKEFTIVVGDTLALTPPMGWNSWYIHYHRVTEQQMRNAADTMIQSGMADVGYMYVNIDDCWMKRKGDVPYRDNHGAVLENAKFPDIRGMVNHIHAQGLRAGLYTSPGPWTCGGYVGAYEHEKLDAQKFAEWGFDFLKYDWCSYSQVATGEGRQKFVAPYQKMGAILKTLDRDLVFNLCQYGMGDVWQWAAGVEGNCWRTTGDLGLASGDQLPGFYHIGLANAQHWKYAQPGHWNDPDYILIGWVGAARGQTVGHPTTLTGNEQYSYMSMWCLMAAPLIFSGDMAKLDPFTVNVLCNSEVIDIDQDALGKQARIVAQDDNQLILAKPLEDGSLAVGLFNLTGAKTSIAVTWKQLGLLTRQRARDLWRQQDIGTYDEQFSAKIPPHGVCLVRIQAQP